MLSINQKVSEVEKKRKEIVSPADSTTDPNSTVATPLPPPPPLEVVAAVAAEVDFNDASLFSTDFIPSAFCKSVSRL